MSLRAVLFDLGNTLISYYRSLMALAEADAHR
jgi:hypothetical protein